MAEDRFLLVASDLGCARAAVYEPLVRRTAGGKGRRRDEVSGCVCVTEEARHRMELRRAVEWRSHSQAG
jgi:hypothetical protein